MLQVKNLKKCYGKFCPLKDINLSLSKGLWVIHGVNGSGKTTFMQILSGLIRETDGYLEIEGSMSFMPQEPMLYEEYRVKDYALLLNFMGGDGGSYLDMMDEIGVERRAYVHTLSYGTKKAVFLGIVLNIPSDIYLLDEPFLGIDSGRRERIEERMRSIAEDSLILITESERTLEPDFILEGGVLNEVH